jgi:hypothetical protein
MSQSRLTAAASPLDLVDEDGKEVRYWLTPLEDIECSELDEYVQAHCIRIARMSLDKNTPQRERDETMRAATETAMSITWTSGVGARWMASVDGMATLLWVSAKKRHPEIKMEDLRKLMLSPENVALLRKKAEEINLGKGKLADKGSPPKNPHRPLEPAPRTRQKKRDRSRR